MIVHVVDVLTLELCAVVVYFVLDVERTVDVKIVLTSRHDDVHLSEAVVGKTEHLMQMLILLLGEVFLAFYLAVDGTGYVVAAVADTLNLRNLTQHGAYLCLRVVAQVGVAHTVEIFGNLNLHVVADGLVFLDACKELCEVGVVIGFEQVAHHREHALYALCKRSYLLTCLKHRELRCLHDTAADETQAEVLVLVAARRLYHLAHHLLHLRYEPYEEERVAYVEHGMEHGKYYRQLLRANVSVGRIVVDNRADYIYKRIEEYENPDNTEHVEHEMCQCSAAGLGVGAECCKVCSYGGADVLTHDKGDTEIYRKHACGAQQDGYGHDGGR